jgi:hypothetical protein
VSNGKPGCTPVYRRTAGTTLREVVAGMGSGAATRGASAEVAEPAAEHPGATGEQAGADGRADEDRARITHIGVLTRY